MLVCTENLLRWRETRASLVFLLNEVEKCAEAGGLNVSRKGLVPLAHTVNKCVKTRQWPALDRSRLRLLVGLLFDFDSFRCSWLSLELWFRLFDFTQRTLDG
jgi:hypothetical protein